MIRLTTIAIALVAIACGGSSNEAAEPTPAPAPAADTAPASDTAPAADPAANPDTTAEAAPAAAPSADADIDAAWKLMQDLEAAAATDGTCKVKADAMNAVIDNNQELIARASKMNDNAEMKKKWDEKYGQQAMELMTKMASEDLKDCMSDPDVGAAMKRLAGE
jgi:hypothetical protein